MTTQTEQSPRSSVENTSPDDITYELLKMEYEKSHARLLYLDEQANKSSSTVFAAMGAFFAIYGYIYAPESLGDFKNLLQSENQLAAIVLVLGIFAVNLIILLTGHHTVQCYRVGGYNKYLEEQLNSYASKPVLQWESKISTKYIHHSGGAILLSATIALTFISFVLTGLYVCWSGNMHPLASLVFTVLLLAELATMTTCIHGILRAHNKIFETVSIDN